MPRCGAGAVRGAGLQSPGSSSERVPGSASGGADAQASDASCDSDCRVGGLRVRRRGHAPTCGRQPAAARSTTGAVARSAVAGRSRRCAPGSCANGLRYYIRRNARPANRVSLRLAVNVGSIHEENDQRGLAHFLEHMAFNGTENFKPGELITFLEIDRRALRPARQRLHVVRRDRLHARRADRQAGLRRSRPARAARLRRRDAAAGRRDRKGARRRHRGVARPARRGLAADRQAAAGAAREVALRRAPADRHARDPQVVSAPAPRRLLPRWYRPDQMAVVVVGDIDPAEAQKMVRAAIRGDSRRVKDAARDRRSHRAAAQGDAVHDRDRSGGAGLVGRARAQAAGRSRDARLATIGAR